MVELRSARDSEGLHLLFDQCGKRQDHTRFPGQGQGVLEILDMKLDPESGFEAALEHVLAAHLEHTRGREAALEHLHNAIWIRAGLGRQQQSLGYRADH